MSERAKAIIFLWASVVVAGTLGFKAGVLKGRAEQKKLDKAECAAHPAVKEVPPETAVTYNGLHLITGWTYDGIRIDPEHKTVTAICPAPKPKKESKRPLTAKERGGHAK